MPPSLLSTAPHHSYSILLFFTVHLLKNTCGTHPQYVIRFKCLCSFSWQPHGSLDFKRSWHNHEPQTQVSTPDHSSSSTKSFKDTWCWHVPTWALDNHHSSFIPTAASLTVFTSLGNEKAVFPSSNRLTRSLHPHCLWSVGSFLNIQHPDAIHRSLTHWEPSKWTSFYATSYQQKDFLN